jgi:hypothetical protein
MRMLRNTVIGLGLCITLLGMDRVWAAGPKAKPGDARPVASALSLDDLPPAVRERVRRIMAQPTIASRGSPESFAGNPELYEFFLDHPDRAVTIWRRLGAKCMEIIDRGGGHFVWTDHQGSEVHWETLQRQTLETHGDGLRLWIAEGTLKPGPLLPRVNVQAVAVLHYRADVDERGHALLHHQAELFVTTDSKTAALIAKMLGPTAPRIADQCLAQLQLFFAAIVWYVDRYPERADALLN